MFNRAQAALGAAEALRIRVQSGVDRLKETIRVESEQFEQEQKNGISAGRYFYFKNHLVFLERELLSLSRELEKAFVEVELHKQALIECDKAVKTLESVEARDRELYRLAQNRKEQKKLDDVAVLNVYRNHERGDK